MDLKVLALTLEALGTIFIAYTALQVHIKMRKEHRIDKPVIDEIKHEEVVAVIGIAFVAIGYFLQIFFV